MSSVRNVRYSEFFCLLLFSLDKFHLCNFNFSKRQTSVWDVETSINLQFEVVIVVDSDWIVKVCEFNVVTR